MWQDWTNGVMGLALLAVAVLDLIGSSFLSGMTLMWTLAVGGAIIAVVGFWGAGEVAMRSDDESRTLKQA